jgi:hypothetical protein
LVLKLRCYDALIYTGGHPPGSMEPFRMESCRINFLAKLESFRMNLSEGILQNILSAKPEPFRMESFRKYSQQNWNLSENIFSKTRIFQNGIFQKRIFQKESLRNIFFSQLESFRMESFRKKISKTRIFQNGIFQKGIFQKQLYDPTGII